MEITYEAICKKLGFDPMKDKPASDNKKDPWLIDDSESPYSVLTMEESDFLIDYYKHHDPKLRKIFGFDKDETA